MASDRRGTNPFATSCVRPGALQYACESPEEFEHLLTRIEAGREHQIVGPHGTGKSTLIHSLRDALAARGWQCASRRIHPGRKPEDDSFFPKLAAIDDSPPRGALFVDGFEQLSWWSRRRWRSAARRIGWTLIVTCHQDLGLPTLVHVRPSLATVQGVVDRLQAGYPQRIQPADVASQWREHQPNVRELLFGLYDLYEQRGGDVGSRFDS